MQQSFRGIPTVGDLLCYVYYMCGTHRVYSKTHMYVTSSVIQLFDNCIIVIVARYKHVKKKCIHIYIAAFANFICFCVLYAIFFNIIWCDFYHDFRNCRPAKVFPAWYCKFFLLRMNPIVTLRSHTTDLI